MKRFRIIGVFLAFALLMAACGNDDETTAAGEDDTTTTEADGGTDTTDDDGSDTTDDDSGPVDNGGATDVGITETEVRVALVSESSGSGNASSNGIGFDKGFEAYIEMINEEGGVDGRQINLVAEYDDQGNPDLNIQFVKQAYEQDEAFTIVGCFSKFGAVDYVEENKLPTLGCAHDPPNWERSTYALGGAPGGNWKDQTPDEDVDPPPSAGVAYVMEKLGLTKLGVFSYNHPGSKAGSETICEAAEENFGHECVFEDYTLEFGFTDIGASVQKLKDSGAEFVYGAMDSGGGLTIIRSLKRAAIDIPTLWAVPLSEEQAAASADLIGSYYAVTSVPPFDGDDPAILQLREELEDRKPGTELSQPVINGWVQGMLLVEGLKAAGPEVTRAKFFEAIRSMDNFESGLTAPVDFTKSPEEKAREGIDPDPDVCATVLLLGDPEQGKTVQVGQKPRVCLNAVDTPEELKALVAEDDSSVTLE